MRGFFRTANEFVQYQARIGMKMKRRAIYEHDGDQAINAGFNQVAFVNKIADSELSDINVGARDGDQAHHCLQFANGGRAHHLLSAVGGTIMTILCSGAAARHVASPMSGVAFKYPDFRARDVRIKRSD